MPAASEPPTRPAPYQARSRPSSLASLRLQSEFGKDTQFEKLDYVRDWRAFVNACRADFDGMGGSEKSAHSFTWITRDC